MKAPSHILEMQVMHARAHRTQLKYFDCYVSITIQADASEKNLIFLLKSLKYAETKYANMKSELWVAVFSFQHIHTYMYWLSFLVEWQTFGNDHTEEFYYSMPSFIAYVALHTPV